MNLSQAELARRLGVSPQTVYKWETDRVKIERAVMMDLALKQLARELVERLDVELAPRPGQGVGDG